jgi:hypothetical protein
MFGEIILLKMRWNADIKHLGNWLHSQQKQQKDDDENKA